MLALSSFLLFIRVKFIIKSYERVVLGISDEGHGLYPSILSLVCMEHVMCHKCALQPHHFFFTFEWVY